MLCSYLYLPILKNISWRIEVNKFHYAAFSGILPPPFPLSGNNVTLHGLFWNIPGLSRLAVLNWEIKLTASHTKQTHALDRAATGTDMLKFMLHKY